MTSWSDAEPLAALLTRLRSADSVRELFASAAELARRELPFDRAVVLTIAPGCLTAEDSDALQDAASDRLRRRVLARRVALPPGPLDDPAPLTEALGLTSPCVGFVAPAGVPLALLVVDRDGPPPGDDDRGAVTAFATTLGLALEQTILRMRSASIAAELRHLTASAEALVAELQQAPLALPSAPANGRILTWHGVAEPPGTPLSARETEILDRLVVGRSNREIAEELVLAPDTVKGHVARILRKLGAANRVEAVSRYLSLTSGRRP